MNLIRNVAGLLIILMLLPILLMAFRYTSGLPFSYAEVYDELAMMQLRESLLISYDLVFTENELSFILHNRDFHLSLVGDMLIMQPGTQIFLSDVDDLHFAKRNGVIYVCYRRNKTEYERALTCAEGFYLNRFSDCDVRDDEPDRSEDRLYD